jgi:hypothetical protein
LESLRQVVARLIVFKLIVFQVDRFQVRKQTAETNKSFVCFIRLIFRISIFRDIILSPGPLGVILVTKRRSSHFPPALKHGAYSDTTVLPGEDPAAFKRLQDDVIAEFAPAGPLEEDIIESIASLMWRKQNLVTYRSAARARDQHSAILAKYAPHFDYRFNLAAPDPRSPAEIHADQKAAEEEAKNALGEAFQFVTLGKIGTIERLLEDLAVIDRLDGMIERYVKRLLLVRGAKSISAPAAPEAHSRRLAAR